MSRRLRGHRQGAAALVVITGCLLVAAASAAAAACPELCPAAAAPVCGEDGLPYASPCVAACAGARVAHRGYCAGGPGALKFVVPDSRRGARKERQAVITREVMQQYSGAGFSYLGRVNLADAPSGPAFSGGNATQLGGSSGGRRFANEAGPAHAHGGRRSGAVAGASSSGELGGGSASSGGGSSGHLHALRYTPAGDVYYARLNASAAAALSRIPPTPPAAAAAGGGSSAAPAAAGAELLSAAAGASSRALRSIIGSDDRESCGQPPAYPMTAVGELEFVAQNQDYICSGALVRPNRVLTAAHCVWSVADRSFVRGVSFAAGRHRTPAGVVVSPFGAQAWRHVTLISDLPSELTPGSDMAVVTLESEVSAEAGTMGVEAGCSDYEAARPVLLRTAGYASDRLNGECVTQACPVHLGCAGDSTAHTCDTYMGQSGSPFFDARNFIRGVHVRGMPSLNEFSNVNARTLASILA